VIPYETRVKTKGLLHLISFTPVAPHPYAGLFFVSYAEDFKNPCSNTYIEATQEYVYREGIR